MPEEKEQRRKHKPIRPTTYGGRTKWYHRWLAVFAILTIPIYTLAFSMRQSPFKYTISQMGNFFGWDHRLDFIIWGIVVGACFMFYLGYLYRRANFRHKKARTYLILANVFLVLTVITPSIKEVFPIYTRLHMLFSILFALSLVITTAFFIQYLGEVDEQITEASTKWAQVIIGGSVLSLFIFGKTGIFEIFFLLTFSIFLMVLGGWLRREELLEQLRDKLPTEGWIGEVTEKLTKK